MRHAWAGGPQHPEPPSPRSSWARILRAMRAWWDGAVGATPRRPRHAVTPSVRPDAPSPSIPDGSAAGATTSTTAPASLPAPVSPPAPPGDAATRDDPPQAGPDAIPPPLPDDGPIPTAGPSPTAPSGRAARPLRRVGPVRLPVTPPPRSAHRELTEQLVSIRRRSAQLSDLVDRQDQRIAEMQERLADADIEITRLRALVATLQRQLDEATADPTAPVSGLFALAAVIAAADRALRATPPSGSLITVLLVTLNWPDTLAGALESVLAQSYPHWELVVVDDRNAPAGPPPLLPDPRVRVVATHGAGTTAAFQRGLELAGGALVAYLDDSCRMAPDWLLALAHAVDRWPAVPVFAGATAEARPGVEPPSSADLAVRLGEGAVVLDDPDGPPRRSALAHRTWLPDVRALVASLSSDGDAGGSLGTIQRLPHLAATRAGGPPAGTETPVDLTTPPEAGPDPVVLPPALPRSGVVPPPAGNPWPEHPGPSARHPDVVSRAARTAMDELRVGAARY